MKCLGVSAAILLAATLGAQPPEEFRGPGGGGFRGPGGPFGPGGPGGPMGETRKVLKDFDKDGDGRLNAEERAAARKGMAAEPRRGRMGPPPGMRADGEPPKPGRKVSPTDVQRYGKEPLYAPDVVRTLFLEFENSDWEKELEDFHNTDVEVPAKLTVDGKSYRDVGVHFRGASSYMMTPAGRKRSLNLSIDDVHKQQRLLGYRTLNLLNANGDPTLLRSVLFLQIAREYTPAPKANFVRVVINGEDWGIYPNVQQYNTDFVKEWFQTTGGARWKTPGSPMGRAGLAYLGEDPGAYRRLYEIKSKDNAKSWEALIRLCRVLNQTPPDQLEAALRPILDIDGTLRFLALDKALINNDGYWTRASDYSLYLDEKGRFHLFPHDANETLMAAEGMGMRVRFGGPGGPGPNGRGPRPRGEGQEGPGPGGAFRPPPENAKLDPFAGETDPQKALLHRLLAVPSLRAKYLGYVQEIAAKWLDWNRLGPIAKAYQQRIAPFVAADTRKLYSTEAFEKGLTEDVTLRGGPMMGPMMFGRLGRGPGGGEGEGPRLGPDGQPPAPPQGGPAPMGPGGMGPGGPGRKSMGLKVFAEERRAFLLDYKEAPKPKPETR